MDGIIEAFHIDLKLLLAQTINFALVFGVLYFFALKPIFSKMGERTNKIEKGIKDAEEMEKQLAKAKEDYNEELSKARKEANQIIDKAGKLADDKRKEMIVLAKKEVDDYMQREKAAINLEKTEMMAEVRREAAELITAALEKILEEKKSSKQDQEIIEKTLEGIKR